MKNWFIHLALLGIIALLTVIAYRLGLIIELLK